MMNPFRKLSPLAVLLAFTTALAQEATCGALVQQAMREVETACADTGRNQACYGYFSLEATARDDAPPFSFDRQGDLADVAALEAVRLEPLDEASDTWGIVMMKLQASLPETLPGQNVTFLLFGDVEMRSAVDPEAEPNLQPMQAFYFNTGITQTECASAPADGILIQTPQGVGKVHMNANGVDIQLGSTAFLQAQPDESLTINVLEGESYVRSEGRTVVVPDGAKVDVPVDEDGMAIGEPGDPEAYDLEFLEDLPIDLLPEEFEIDEPADDAELEEAYLEGEDLDLLDDEADFDDEDLDEDFDEDFGDEDDFGGEDDFGEDEGFDDAAGDDGDFEDEGDFSGEGEE